MELARTASGLLLAPFLQLASESLRPRIDLKQWPYGHCPVCGGKPCFAALQVESGLRILLCCRCGGQWSFRRTGCPFCMTLDPQIYYPSEDGKYRLYVCEVCKGYLKTAAILKEPSEVFLPVEAIVTVPMDIAAQQAGYKAPKSAKAQSSRRPRIGGEDGDLRFSSSGLGFFSVFLFVKRGIIRRPSSRALFPGA